MCSARSCARVSRARLVAQLRECSVCDCDWRYSQLVFFPCVFLLSRAERCEFQIGDNKPIPFFFIGGNHDQNAPRSSSFHPAPPRFVGGGLSGAALARARGAQAYRHCFTVRSRCARAHRSGAAMAGHDAFLTSLWINALFGFCFCLGFCLLRTRLRVIYSPRRRLLKGSPHAPPALPPGLLAWIKPLIELDEPTFTATAGLDATMYLR